MGVVWRTIRAAFRFSFIVLNNAITIPSYLLYLVLLLPLLLFAPDLFWVTEGVMFRWLLAMVASWGWSAGYTVMEWGADVSSLADDEALVMANHQSTGDVCTLMMCLQDKGNVVRNVMWLMDYVFKYTNFGIVSIMHGDFFIKQGKAQREQQVAKFESHLSGVWHERRRRWLVLFPEGGFLRKRLKISQRYGERRGLPTLHHVTLPRTGAILAALRALVAPQRLERSNSITHDTGTGIVVGRNATALQKDSLSTSGGLACKDQSALHSDVFVDNFKSVISTDRLPATYQDPVPFKEVLKPFYDGESLAVATQRGRTECRNECTKKCGVKGCLNGQVAPSTEGKSLRRGLHWLIDVTIAYPGGKPMDIQTWVLALQPPMMTHVHYRVFPMCEVPLEDERLEDWIYQRFMEKERLLEYFYRTGAFPAADGETNAVPRPMSLNNSWLVLLHLWAFASGAAWFTVLYRAYSWFI
uniref:acyl-CoA:lysophosphatidylglycerol acyltransferase 1 n=1 Tax=Myxine glutinosa TaxID=7769 RepID=UPI00358FD8C8